MGARRNKEQVLDILAAEKLEEAVLRLQQFPVKDVVNALFSAVCRGNDLVHWHAVRCMGIFVARLAEEDMEEARIVMRRMLWSLNDESGGIGWGIPEAMAEAMYHHSGLAGEYVHMLISYTREDGEELFQDGNYLEHETLQRGLLWGIGRLAEKRPDMLLQRDVAVDLLHYLESGDAVVRGFAARSLGLLRAEKAAGRLAELLDDSSSLQAYLDDRLQTVTVAELAAEALQRIRHRDTVS
jgi:hypothetical protein